MIEKSFKKPAQLSDKIDGDTQLKGLPVSLLRKADPQGAQKGQRSRRQGRQDTGNQPSCPVLSASIRNYGSVCLNCELQEWFIQQDKGILN
jgi:hypothetical protein